MVEAVVNSSMIRPIDLSATFLVAAAVLGADAGYPAGFLGSGAGAGIDGSSAVNYFENAGTDLVAGNYYGAWSDFDGGATIDLTGNGSSFSVHFRVSSTYNSVDTVRIVLKSGAGTTDYGYWDFPVSTNDVVTWKCFRVHGTPDGTGGTFDPANITGLSLQVRVSAPDQYAMSIFWDQPIFVDGRAMLGDSGAITQTSMQGYFDLLNRVSSSDVRSMLINKAGTTFELGFGAEFVSEDYLDSTVATGIAFMAPDGIGIRSVPTGFYQLAFTPPINGSQIRSGFTAATISADYDLIIDASASGCSLQFSASLFAGVNDVDISGSGAVFSSSNILSPATVDIGDADLRGLTVDSCDGPVVITSDLITGSVLNVTNPVSDSLQFDLVAGDYSDLTFNIPASTVNISLGGSFNLAGIQSGGSVEFDNLSASDSIITINSDITTAVASPTTGGGNITFVVDATISLSVTVLDDETGAPINGARVRLMRVSDNSQLIEGSTDTQGLISTTINYDSDTPVFGWAREMDLAGDDYFPEDISGTYTNNGFAATVRLRKY